MPGLGRQGGGGDQANGFLSFGSAPASAVLPTPSEDPVGCTGLFLPVLPVLVAAATAGERRGGPALGWGWLVAAALPILLRLRRTEEPELGPRCTRMILGRRATTPRRSRRGSSSTHKAVSGDGVSSVKGLADTCIFLWRLPRRRRRSTAGDGFICGLAPQGPNCIFFSFFGGLFACVLGHLLSLGVSRRCCICATSVSVSG